MIVVPVLISECIELLLKHGADPGIMSKDKALPINFTTDNAARAVIHAACRKKSAGIDKSSKITLMIFIRFTVISSMSSISIVFITCSTYE